MSRYIDAEKLIKVLRDGMIDENDWSYESPAECRGVLEFSIAEVKKIPTADVAEVKRGRWIVDTAFGNDVMSDEQMVICSVCGKGIFWGKQNFCPNCGSRMVDEDE